MKMIAYIPARGGSKRIPLKNIRPLGGKPAIAHVIEAVKKLKFLSGVCVSTDSREIQAVAKQFGAEALDLRPQKLSDDHSTLKDLLDQDVERFLTHFKIKSEEASILMPLATAALVGSQIYDAAYKDFTAAPCDFLVATTGFEISPYWALTKTAKGQWQPLFPDKMTTRSQDLPATQVDAGLFYMLNYAPMQNLPTSWFLAKKMKCFKVPVEIAVDVDREEDWAELEKKFSMLRK